MRVRPWREDESFNWGVIAAVPVRALLKDILAHSCVAERHRVAPAARVVTALEDGEVDGRSGAPHKVVSYPHA